MANAESSKEERYLPPTEKRLRDAAKDGQVARSRDAAHALMMLCALAGVVMFGPGLAQQSFEFLAQGLKLQAGHFTRPELMSTQLASLGWQALLAAMPLMLVCALGAAIGSLLPGGFNWAPKAAAMQWNKVSPLTGFARLFSGQALIELIKLIVVAVVVLAVGLFYAWNNLPMLAGLENMNATAASAQALFGSTQAMAWMAGVMFLVACIDAPWQWIKHRDNLKMSHQEVRQEAKESDGDPLVKGRIRSKQREFSRSRMLAAVPAADVVLTNPTHFSVALRYDPLSMAAPVVVAKGGDELAFKIREIATQAGVPLVEAPPLARALFQHAKLDQEIPAALFAAVAQVLAYLYQLKQFIPGKNTAPPVPSDWQVPAELDPGVQATEH
jgi:flagellar biosynthesis protein FlhB